jgi:3-oxoacyl-[acyl-carrier protein] reductase
MSTQATLITGSSKGIGRAISLEMVKDNQHVIGLYNSTNPVGFEDYSDYFHPLKCDITNTDDIDKTFIQISEWDFKIDKLILCAGITKDNLILMMKPNQWHEVIETNLNASFYLLKKTIPHMIKARHGRIVFISSVVAFLGSPGQVNYAATKAAVVGMARSLARELASRNITVNVVAPGAIKTDMLIAAGQKRVEELTNMIPLGYLGTPEDVASLVKFLCSDQASYITGAVVPVDGGLGMGL